MKLQPFDPAQEALKLAGIGVKNLEESKKVEASQNKFAELLNEHGASLEDIARGMGSVLRNGEPTEIIRVSQLALQTHGVLREADKPTIPAIHINIMGKEQRSLLQLVTPNIHNAEIEGPTN